MYAKNSYSGLRFFAHASHAPDCEIARQGESEAHHLLKLELASAARDAGAHAEPEVRAPDGSWRADVLATDPGGEWTMALDVLTRRVVDAGDGRVSVECGVAAVVVVGVEEVCQGRCPLVV